MSSERTLLDESRITRRHVRVIVLGAGISGLVVGYELGKRGYD